MKLKHVVIIEDNEVDALICEKIIEQVSPQIKIYHFTDGKSALADLSNLLLADTESFPQLILLDLYMPFMDGWQFLEAYRQLIEDNKISCIVYVNTNSHDINHWIMARNNPVVENLLIKPFSHNAFSRILHSHFSL